MIDSSGTADDLVVLVDGEDATLGVARKFDVHADGRLHRAVSVMLVDTGERVLLQRRAEMGIEDCELTPATPFVYRERVTAGLVEHEFDHLFVGVWHGDPQPDPEEVSEWRWMRLAPLRHDVAENGQRYTAWLSHVLEHLPGLASHHSPRSG